MKNLNKLLTASMVVTFIGCATPKLWIVSSDQNGGVIGYSGYRGEDSYKQLQEDIKKTVQCPDSFVLQAWERKSQTTQESMVVPVTNNSTTTTSSSYAVNNSYGSNVFNINGDSTSRTTGTSYEVVPYTSTENWVEQKYVCDWNKAKREHYLSLSVDEKIKFHEEKCIKGEIKDCRILVNYYVAEKKDKVSAKLTLEKICSSGDPKYGPGACVGLVLGFGENSITTFKKGCDIIKNNSSKPLEDGYLSCAYYGAMTKNESDFNIGLPYMLSTCNEDKKNCYDLACAYSLLGNKNKSLDYLKISLDAGYDNWKHIDTDTDLNNVKKSKEFKELIRQYQSRTPAEKP